MAGSIGSGCLCIAFTNTPSATTTDRVVRGQADVQGEVVLFKPARGCRLNHHPKQGLSLSRLVWRENPLEP